MEAEKFLAERLANPDFCSTITPVRLLRLPTVFVEIKQESDVALFF